jgi:hypothetical protein
VSQNNSTVIAVGADKHEKNRRNRLPPFVPLLLDTLDASAWRAMSHGARSLYVALRRRFGTQWHNNGRIFLSQRVAAKEIGSHHNEIARWFRELQHYGFIVMTTPGHLGVEGRGKAPRWRLTELGCMREVPTRDFVRWMVSRSPTKNQNPVPEKAHTACRKRRTLS